MLDLGFDVGRHAIYVASLCFETWAFDDSATEVNLARERAEEAGENGGDKLVHGSGGISQLRAE